ncbi:MAG: TonB-dependent receptor, partial [Odoribacter sp.]|nr:TonB-dependent receptor [Odoribacter sp.]
YKGNDILNGFNNLITEGKPINIYKMVRWAGVNPANGDALYYTADGDITNVYNADDAVILDGKTPYSTLFGSFGLNLSYKGLDFSADFYYSHGNYIYNHVSYFVLSDGADATKNQDRKLLYDQWLKPGDITDVPRQDISNNQHMSTRYLEDASYLRLRTLGLGYTLPNHITSKAGLNKVRVFAQGVNLLTWTGFTGMDPEIGTLNAVATGSEGSVYDFNYPSARTVMFGLEISF